MGPSGNFQQHQFQALPQQQQQQREAQPFYCPQCRMPSFNINSRLVREACGHLKCRKCLLQEDAGCLQCLEELRTQEKQLQQHHQKRQQEQQLPLPPAYRAPAAATSGLFSAQKSALGPHSYQSATAGNVPQVKIEREDPPETTEQFEQTAVTPATTSNQSYSENFSGQQQQQRNTLLMRPEILQKRAMQRGGSTQVQQQQKQQPENYFMAGGETSPSAATAAASAGSPSVAARTTGGDSIVFRGGGGGASAADEAEMSPGDTVVLPPEIDATCSGSSPGGSKGGGIAMAGADGGGDSMAAAAAELLEEHRNRMSGVEKWAMDADFSLMDDELEWLQYQYVGRMHDGLVSAAKNEAVVERGKEVMRGHHEAVRRKRAEEGREGEEEEEGEEAGNVLQGEVNLNIVVKKEVEEDDEPPAKIVRQSSFVPSPLPLPPLPTSLSQLQQQQPRAPTAPPPAAAAPVLPPRYPHQPSLFTQTPPTRRLTIDSAPPTPSVSGPPSTPATPSVSRGGTGAGRGRGGKRKRNTIDPENYAHVVRNDSVREKSRL